MTWPCASIPYQVVSCGGRCGNEHVGGVITVGALTQVMAALRAGPVRRNQAYTASRDVLLTSSNVVASRPFFSLAVYPERCVIFAHFSRRISGGGGGGRH